MAGNGVGCGDFHLAFEQLCHLGELFLPGFQQGEGGLDVVVEQPPLRRQGDPPRAPDKQRRVEGFLQIRDRLAHRGLGDKQLPRRFGKGLGAGDGAEDLVLFQIGVHKHSL